MITKTISHYKKWKFIFNLLLIVVLCVDIKTKTKKSKMQNAHYI